MQLPIVKPAPIVQAHARVFRHLFENQCQYRHFQNYLTGLMVLENKSLANISRCILDSADKTNLSRFLSQASWSEEKVNSERIKYLLNQTVKQRQTPEESFLIFDDTLCEHVGSLFEYVDRHYNHCNQYYPLAHNLVTSHYLSGSVRFPVDLRIYRRYEEITRWAEFVSKHFPQQEIPKKKKERQKLHKLLDKKLLEDPEFQELHSQFTTKIALAVELIEQARSRQLPFTTVLMDSWYLAPDIVAALKEHKLDWVSLLKKNRNLEVNSFVLRDEAGQPITLTGPHIKVEELVPLIPRNAYRKVQVGDQVYWCFTRSLQVPGLGKVRLVISFENPELIGTYAVLLSNRTDWSAQKILASYFKRWPIETFYQDSKGHLGLDQYRMRTAKAIQKHWCLVFVAYSLLHLVCLPSSLISGSEQLISHPIKTIGQICRQQGQKLIEELIIFTHEQLQQGQPATDVFSRLFMKQNKEVPA
ncbi:MAG: transposase [Xenococcus sp. MO_188.B8]|nr:transposase [Xenococcus sp. MO_188.B8]